MGGQRSGSRLGETSRIDLFLRAGKRDDAAVSSWVVGFAADPCAPDDLHPGAGQDAYDEGVVAAAAPRSLVDAFGPHVGMARVAGQAGDGLAQPVVARPAKSTQRVLPHRHVAGTVPAFTLIWPGGKTSSAAHRAANT